MCLLTLTVFRCDANDYPRDDPVHNDAVSTHTHLSSSELLLWMIRHSFLFCNRLLLFIFNLVCCSTYNVSFNGNLITTPYVEFEFVSVYD